jgi:hypothetical protein
MSLFVSLPVSMFVSTSRHIKKIIAKSDMNMNVSIATGSNKDMDTFMDMDICTDRNLPANKLWTFQLTTLELLTLSTDDFQRLDPRTAVNGQLSVLMNPKTAVNGNLQRLLRPIQRSNQRKLLFESKLPSSVHDVASTNKK